MLLRFTFYANVVVFYSGHILLMLDLLGLCAYHNGLMGSTHFLYMSAWILESLPMLEDQHDARSLRDSQNT